MTGPTSATSTTPVAFRESFSPVVAPDPSWRTKGLCNTLDGSLWQPRFELDDDWRPVRAGDNQGLEAKAVCRRCPVLGDCLLAGLDAPEGGGIWGGAGGDVRKRLRGWRRHHDTSGCHGPGCGCGWLEAWLAHLDGRRVPYAPLQRVDTTCGKRSGYAKGCRCGGCTLSALLDVGKRRAGQRGRAA